MKYCGESKMLYTDLFLALHERKWSIFKSILFTQKVKVICPAGGTLVRDMQYGPEGDLAEFFLHKHLSVNRLREISSIIDDSKKIVEPDKLENLNIASKEVEEEISRVENKILILMGIYVGGILTFTLSDQGVLIFFAASTAIVSTLYCKHANHPYDFVDNIKSALYDKLIEPICVNKFHSRIYTSSSEKDNPIPSF